MLGNIPELFLISCSSIVNISNLQNNSEVVISHCSSIRDYSQSFKNPKIINLIDVSLEEVKIDVINYENVVELHVGGGYGISRNVTLPNVLPSTLKHLTLELFYPLSLYHRKSFDQLENIELDRCTGIETAEALGTIPKVRLSYLLDLISVQGLGKGNREVRISNCPHVSDFSSLRYIPRVTADYCSGFSKINEVDSVLHLKIVSKRNDHDFRLLKKTIQSLDITDIYKTRLLQVCENIPLLYLTEHIFTNSVLETFKPNNEKIIIGGGGLSSRLKELFSERYMFDTSSKGKVILIKRVQSK